MKRRTLDLVFSVGGVLLAALLVVLGMVLKTNADFAKSYVKDQLTEQQITFTPVAGLTGDAKNSVCLNNYAGKLMDSGKMAECYANDYIALHLREGATAAGQEGKTYATLGSVVTAANKAVADAKAAATPTDELQKTADSLKGLRETMFKGETLRGLLLTSYGFSEFGRKATQAEFVAFAAALILLLASIAGFIHAMTTSKDKIVAAVSHTA